MVDTGRLTGQQGTCKGQGIPPERSEVWELQEMRDICPLKKKGTW